MQRFPTACIRLFSTLFSYQMQLYADCARSNWCDNWLMVHWSLLTFLLFYLKSRKILIVVCFFYVNQIDLKFRMKFYFLHKVRLNVVLIFLFLFENRKIKYKQQEDIISYLKCYPLECSSIHGTMCVQT